VARVPSFSRRRQRGVRCIHDQGAESDLTDTSTSTARFGPALRLRSVGTVQLGSSMRGGVRVGSCHEVSAGSEFG